MPKIWYGRTPWLDEPEFHKPDMERLGFFKELKYVTIDDPYMPEGELFSSIEFANFYVVCD